MKTEIQPGQIWRHFKGGVYRVLYLAKHSETGEELVIYTKNDSGGTVWARPASMWLETVERDGKRQPRFDLILENSCEDCHWYETEEQYCFRNGCHAYDESSCEYWIPREEDE